VLNIYCSTKVKSSVRTADKLPGYLKSSKSTKSVDKRWLAVILCLVLVFSAAGGSGTGTGTGIAQADDGGYLFDRVIGWGDGSTEHIQIGEDGFFILNGVKKRLIGIDLRPILSWDWDPPYRLTDAQYWLPEKLAIWDKELGYLESIGVRLVIFNPFYVIGWPGPGSEEERYSAVFDLIYKHKMLVLPHISARIMGRFTPDLDDLTNPDFSWNLWTSWSQNCTPTFLFPEPGRSGGSCMGIEMSEIEPFDPWSTATWLQNVPVVAGKSYSIAGWIRTENVIGKGGAMIVLDWKRPEGEFIGDTQFMNYVQGTTGWTYYEGEVTAPPGATFCTVCCRMGDCSGKAWFDDDIVLGEESLPKTDSMGAWAERFADVIAKYRNVVAVVLGNELNKPSEAGDPGFLLVVPEGQEYTPSAAANYLNFLANIFRSRVDVPMVQNLVGGTPWWTTPKVMFRPDIMEACLAATDWPCFTIYGPTLEVVNDNLTGLTLWLRETGYPATGWWLAELNKVSPSEADGDSAGFNVEYIESALENGASVVCLFTTYDCYQRGLSFFNASGDPIPSMVAIGGEIDRLQAPLSEAQTVARR